jgi:murein DD-endopeptidase MepM/ murein hydrolase activator NlpD
MVFQLRRKLIAVCALGLTAVLMIGQTSAARIARAAQTTTPPIQIHVVQAGETLESIAATFNVSPARLAKVNLIDQSGIVSIGDRLVIPHAPGADAPGSGIAFTVGLGDTLELLAARYQTTPQEIGLANRVIKADLIVAGQTLSIPSQGQSADDVDILRLSTSQPLWRAALAANSNIIAVAIANGFSSATDGSSGSLVRVAAVENKTSILHSPWVSMNLNTPPLEAGRSAAISVTVDGPGAISGSFLSRDIHFVGSGNDYVAIIGVERWTRPGTYPLTIAFTDASGKVSTHMRSVMVHRGNYASEILKLSEEAAAVRSDPTVVANELVYLTQKMSGFTPERYWSGLFRIPSSGIFTSAFGSVRSINGGGYDSYHAGNDFAATTGTPIFAPADGVVVDTGLLEVRGYSTIIDHGMGVYSGYWHQAGIEVKPGDRVTAGQQIGVVGNTGSSTASHLHWEMWVGGVPVDSLQWVRQVFP